jgi:hypothetical protein
MMDYIVICSWIVDFNIGMKLDLVVMFLYTVFVIIGSSICTHRPPLSFVLLMR